MTRNRYDIRHRKSPRKSEASVRRVDVVWGGELATEEGSSVTLEQGLSSPIMVARSIWKGPGSYYRSTHAVRERERHYHLVSFVDHGRMVVRPTRNEVSVGGGFFAVTKFATGYHADMIPDRRRGLVILQAMVPDHMIAPYLVSGARLGQPMDSTQGEGLMAKTLAGLLYEHGGSMSVDSRDRMIALFLNLVSECLSHTAIAARGSAMQAQRYREILQFVQENISDPNLSAKMIARSFRVSTRYISVILSANDTTFPRLLRETRINAARELLKRLRPEDYSIGEIAALVGFKSAPHFTTIFRQQEQCTPGAYRKQYAALKGEGE